ncbi:MAG TPA: Rieske (2Fe-2S) protein [Verrucomicrobiae bacterium]|nr:Rieske (2Fe-2S) protein [Verrucomicrobiae bacterium]
MEYVAAAKVADVPKWGKKVVTLRGREVLLVNAGGTIHALENECPHQGSPLLGGMVKDAHTLTCPRHGYRFDLDTGACRDYPEYTVKVFAVRVEGDQVLVALD